jgi:hypothetical protein
MVQKAENNRIKSAVFCTKLKTSTLTSSQISVTGNSEVVVREGVEKGQLWKQTILASYSDVAHGLLQTH